MKSSSLKPLQKKSNVVIIVKSYIYYLKVKNVAKFQHDEKTANNLCARSLHQHELQSIAQPIQSKKLQSTSLITYT